MRCEKILSDDILVSVCVCVAFRFSSYAVIICLFSCNDHEQESSFCLSSIFSSAGYSAYIQPKWFLCFFLCFWLSQWLINAYFICTASSRVKMKWNASSDTGLIINVVYIYAMKFPAKEENSASEWKIPPTSAALQTNCDEKRFFFSLALFTYTNSGKKGENGNEVMCRARCSRGYKMWGKCGVVVEKKRRKGGVILGTLISNAYGRNCCALWHLWICAI